MPLPKPPFSSGCQCGACRYEATAAPHRLYVCHCTECRKQSASAFGISVVVPADRVRLPAGAPQSWTRATDSGDRLDCVFCPACGSRLWHRRHPAPERLSIQGGSLDQPPDLSEAIHIWTNRKLPGVVIPRGGEA